MQNKAAKLNKLVLEKGIQNWLTHSNWPHDFHSTLYRDLNLLLRNGVTATNWISLVDILWDWRAIRPATKQFVRDRGLITLPDVNQAVTQILRRHQNSPSITDVTWSEIAPLFLIIKGIKNVSSPVFASKLCHFLLPDVFPVIDNEFIGVNGDYKDYWILCSRLWGFADDELKAELKAQLGKFIPTEKMVGYPWATKIVEICLSGQ